VRKQICIFIGPPGSGKGSLSSLCVKQLGFIQLSTGNLCRKHIAENTALGKEIDFAIKSGKLISDRLIIEMVGQWLTECQGLARSIILDGFPRTVAQANMLNEFLKEKFSGLEVYVLRMKVSDENLVQRILGRSVCENKNCQAVYSTLSDSTLKPQRSMVCDECSSQLKKRSDDNEETLHNRLLAYHKHENELLDFYKRIGKTIHELDGEKPLENVFEHLKNILNV
jgi:adenylate kinase